MRLLAQVEMADKLPLAVSGDLRAALKQALGAAATSPLILDDAPEGASDP